MASRLCGLRRGTHAPTRQTTARSAGDKTRRSSLSPRRRSRSERWAPVEANPWTLIRGARRSHRSGHPSWMHSSTPFTPTASQSIPRLHDPHPPPPPRPSHRHPSHRRRPHRHPIDQKLGATPIAPRPPPPPPLRSEITSCVLRDHPVPCFAPRRSVWWPSEICTGIWARPRRLSSPEG